MSNATNYNFILNYVEGILASEKGLKLFEYLKQNINFNGLILFQETHSSMNDGKQWKDKFDDPLRLLWVEFVFNIEISLITQLDFVEKILST